MSLQSLIKHHLHCLRENCRYWTRNSKKKTPCTDFPDILFSKTRLQHDVGIPDVELAVAGLVVGDRLEVLFKRKKKRKEYNIYIYFYLGKACICIFVNMCFFFLGLCMSQCSHTAQLHPAQLVKEIRRLIIIKVGQGSECGVAEREKMMALFLAAYAGKMEEISLGNKNSQWAL